MRNIHSAQFHQVKATLYFGANIPFADPVEPEVGALSFARFLRDSVTPHFPGFTLATLQGYWKGEPETARVLTILADDTDAFRQQIRIIAEHYKSDYGQEAVAYEFVEAAFTLNCWPFGPVASYHKPGLGY